MANKNKDNNKKDISSDRVPDGVAKAGRQWHKEAEAKKTGSTHGKGYLTSNKAINDSKRTEK
jgi:hypothetical protein